MKVENSLYPTPDRIAGLMGDASGAPVIMLNLLKFRAKAEYSDGRASDLSGREAYQLYAAKMQKTVEKHGGKFVFSGLVMGMVVGDVEDVWDIAALVEYPSAAAFAKIVTSPEMQEIGVHRSAGLEGQLLIRVNQSVTV